MSFAKIPALGIYINNYNDYGLIGDLCGGHGSNYHKLKQYIPGPMTLVPSKSEMNRYMAYVSDDMDSDMQPNDVGALIMDYLGLAVYPCAQGCFRGPVVLLGTGDTGLSIEAASVLLTLLKQLETSDDMDSDISALLTPSQLDVLFGKIRAQKSVV